MLKSIIDDAAKKYIPHAAIVELTRICNLSCRHCYAPPDKDRRELTHEELCGVIDDLQAMGTLFVTFSGGDPTVNRRYLDIMRTRMARRGSRTDTPYFEHLAQALGALPVWPGATRIDTNAPVHCVAQRTVDAIG